MLLRNFTKKVVELQYKVNQVMQKATSGNISIIIQSTKLAS